MNDIEIRLTETERQLAEVTRQRDEARRENTYIRGQLTSVKCPYGHKLPSGVCSLGYPGCACADDWFAAQDEMHRAMVDRLAALAKERDEARRELAEVSDRFDGLALAYKSIESAPYERDALRDELAEEKELANAGEDKWLRAQSEIDRLRAELATEQHKHRTLTAQLGVEHNRTVEAERRNASLLAELADERAKKSDALIAAVNDIERLSAELTTVRADTLAVSVAESAIAAIKP